MTAPPSAEWTLYEMRRLLMEGRDFHLEVLKGNVPGHAILSGLGERDTIQTTAAGEDVWRGNELSAVPQAPGSHTFIPRPADAGEQMTLVSESNADNGATATGALTVVVVYLDANGDEQTEIVTMDGTTQVDTVATDIRFVQEMRVATVGSNTVAEGNIRIFRESDETRVYCMIAAGGNQSLVPHRMVPRGKMLHIQGWATSEASQAKRVRLRLRADCDNAAPPIRQANVFLFKSVMAMDSEAVMEKVGVAIPEFSVVKASAWAQVAGAEVAVSWWGTLVDA